MVRCSEQSNWPAWTLRIGAVLHLAMAGAVLLDPAVPFRWHGMPAPTPSEVWQAYGLWIGVLGFGLGAASFSPVKHWMVVLLSLAAKVVIPVGFIAAATLGRLPWSLGITILLTDVVWWLPLMGVLYHAFRWQSCTADSDIESWDEAIRSHESQRGANLYDLSLDKRVLVVFVRHAGCTFCREMLADLAAQRARLEAQGMEIAVVHMSSPLRAAELAIQYGLEGVHLYSDPECRLYEAFGLERGTLTQLLGPKVFFRGIWAGLIQGHGLGPLQGDGFRLQGAFVLHQARVLAACRVETAADPIDFISLCKAAKPQRFEEQGQETESTESTETADA